ncbi:uncharacterized protein LOC144205920 [Stigmatopora nigra]
MMAQSVRRIDISMEKKPQSDKTRISYFGNVKSRLGSSLQSGLSQPPTFTKRPWDSQPLGRGLHEPSTRNLHKHHQYQIAPVQPVDHIPHIRNPILRQYYQQGTSWDANSAVKQEQKGRLLNNGKSNSTDESVFCISSQFGSHCRPQSSPLCSALFRTEQQSEVGKTIVAGNLNACKKKMMLETDSDVSDRHVTPAQSPLPEAEYDKLLDVEAVPMPDGQLCLLALPPECCPGEGPDATPYLKLFCRHITDRKGIVSGILLVTTNKLFFDPCKTHPLVKEHGCEEYLLSCSVDKLTSVSFFSDISHVRFHYSQHRKKGKKLFHRLKNVKSQEQKRESLSILVPAALSNLSLKEEKAAPESEQTLSEKTSEKKLDESPSEVLSDASGSPLGVAASFCCGSSESSSPGRTDEAPSSSASSPTAVSRRSPTRSPSSVMFVRLRVQSSAGLKRRVVGFQFSGTEPTTTVRESWIALSEESSDELHAFLEHRRPDLCLCTGGEEDWEADYNEEEFVLVEDKDEKEQVDLLQKQRGSGDDWEMVLMEDNRDKPGLLIEREPDGLHAIVENSHILEASHVRELYKELPPKTVGHTWQLAYSTSRHGASLKSLYRKVSLADSPNLLVIKDTLDEVFGAFLSHPLKLSEKFYGTGETFLFMLHPRFKCFRWTGENSFFIKGDLDSFAIGGGSGHFGLWVDENLYLGRSSPCYTFNNCCLSETDDFRIMELEVWAFC